MTRYRRNAGATFSLKYHLVWCPKFRRPVLISPYDTRLKEIVREVADEHDMTVHTVEVMPDHIHLFVAIDAPLELSAWMKSLKNTLSRTLRMRGVPAPHWQKGFFDHVLRSTESYSQKWEYVADNPRRAGLVTDGDTWAYSGEIHPLRWQGREGGEDK